MIDRLGHKMVLGWLAGTLFFIAGSAQAVSLGKIEVASHLGEPFYAEVPLALEGDEIISRVYVEIAAPTDYRILEVYRDAVLNSLRADVQNDSRGARVELTSRSALDAPFFNLVLKVRYDRATHFKKYPIFLDIPKSIKPKLSSTPLPSVQALKSPTGVDTTMPETSAEPMAAVVETAPEESAKSGFVPYDGWARISRYGPMVYGDTISTVAERLRVDDRFTLQQVMVALFEKNRARFDQDNINLIKAGTFLDVPAAAEVERITPSQARNVIAEHERAWKELKNQPRYAAVAEAQRTRYSKRVLMGQQANGVASSPEETGQATQTGKTDEHPAAPAGTSAATGGMTEGAGNQATGAMSEDAAKELEALKQKNEELQARLAENEKQLEAMKNKPAEEAAASARNEKLEMKLARLQSELDAAREQVSVQQEGGSNWVTWLLGGLIVVLLGVVGILMRREPSHPASSLEHFETPESVAAAAPVQYSESTSSEDEIPEIDVEEADIEAIAGGHDLDATTRMTAEQAREFTDSIPDLTDEDTGEMQAFTEEVEEEPDPNVDYLSEADVYMRYGMEDEALQQVNMALRLNPDNTEAHIKKAEILKGKSDTGEFDQTVADATQTLAGADLERFKEAVSEIQSGDEVTDEVSLEDTLPPTNVSELIGQQAASEEGGISSEETMSEFGDLGFGDAEMDTSGSSEGEDTIVNTGAASDEADLDAALSDLDDLDIAGTEADEAESPVEPEAPAPQVDAALDSDLGGEGLDFDLSDIEMPETGNAPAEESEGMQVETADLDKTVAMDWSKDTSIDSDEFDLLGESGAGEESAEMFEPEAAEPEEPVLEVSSEEGAAEPEEPVFEISAEGEAAEPEEPVLEVSSEEEATEPVFEISAEEEAAPLDETTITHGDTIGVEPEESHAEEGETSKTETTASLDLGDDDLNDGFDISEAEVEPADDFTSTIRTSLDEVGGRDDDFTATGEHDLQFNLDASESMDESMLESVDEGPKEEPENAMDGISLDLDEDEDATQKLDSLLSEFSDDEEDEKKD